MDNKDINNSPQSGAPIDWKSLGFFSAQDYLIYIFKKTEKITSALYLVSGLLKDNEPMKWQLRDRGMDLLNSSFMASSSIPGDKNSVIQSLFTAALETLSLLNVGKISNLISDMNYAIMVKEIDGVLNLLRDNLAANAENAGYVLSESFFKTPDLFKTGFRAEESGKHALDRDRGWKAESRGNKGHTIGDMRKIHESSILRWQKSLNDKKSQRQENIINALRGHSNLTIKDFSKVIKDCSEKTIQRELIELIDKGIVKKDGERRWSKYTLVTGN